MKKNTIIMAVLAIIIIGGGSFYGGMVYGQSRSKSGGQGNFANLTQEQRQQRAQQFGANTGAGFRNGKNGNGGFVSGDIISKDDKSITVKLQDGGSKIIFFSDATQVSKYVSGAPGDLEVGKTVTAAGTANTDGSITAQTIQMRPAMPTVPAQVPAQTK
jgi:hypothetical protein